MASPPEEKPHGWRLLVQQAFVGRRALLRVLAFVAVAYAYVFWQVSVTDWARSDASFGPVVLALAVFLYCLRWNDDRMPERVGAGRGAVATLLLVLAALLFVFGIVGQLTQFSYGSLVLLVLALTLLMQRPATSLYWPVALLALSVPLPGFIVDPVTLPLKRSVAAGTATLLGLLGYPVAREGVILQVGGYQLQVADACAGLRTLFSLEAMGLAYLSLTPMKSRFRNITLALLVFPISMLANLIRVTLLCLITFYFGDAAGQGYLHQFTGLTLFILAIVLIAGVDSILRTIVGKEASVSATGGAQ